MLCKTKIIHEEERWEEVQQNINIDCFMIVGFFFFFPVLLDIFEHKSRESSIINPVFLLLILNDFQHFAIFVHLSPNCWGEDGGSF